MIRTELQDVLFNVTEIYNSIEGEGVQAGKLTTFVRFAGCNLSCKWCDSKYSLGVDRKTKLMTPWNIIKEIKHKNVTLTGGEPLWRNGIIPFIGFLLQQGYHVNLETNGSLPIKKLNSLPNRKHLTIMMDYKAKSSNNRPTTKLENFDYLKDWDAVKFVIASEDDFNEFLDVWENIISGRSIFYSGSRKYQVFLSSCFQQVYPDALYKLQCVGWMRTNNTREYEKRVRLQLQMHKYIWPPEMRGV